MENRCVVCGNIIPEGTIVCKRCAASEDSNELLRKIRDERKLETKGEKR